MSTNNYIPNCKYRVTWEEYHEKLKHKWDLLRYFRDNFGYDKRNYNGFTYEIQIAIDNLGVILWDDISNDFKVKHNLHIRDHGIDGIDFINKRVIQCKNWSSCLYDKHIQTFIEEAKKLPEYEKCIYSTYHVSIDNITMHIVPYEDRKFNHEISTNIRFDRSTLTDRIEARYHEMANAYIDGILNGITELNVCDKVYLYINDYFHDKHEYNIIRNNNKESLDDRINVYLNNIAKHLTPNLYNSDTIRIPQFDYTSIYNKFIQEYNKPVQQFKTLEGLIEFMWNTSIANKLPTDYLPPRCLSSKIFLSKYIDAVKTGCVKTSRPTDEDSISMLYTVAHNLELHNINNLDNKNNTHVYNMMASTVSLKYVLLHMLHQYITQYNNKDINIDVDTPLNKVLNTITGFSDEITFVNMDTSWYDKYNNIVNYVNIYGNHVCPKQTSPEGKIIHNALYSKRSTPFVIAISELFNYKPDTHINIISFKISDEDKVKLYKTFTKIPPHTTRVVYKSEKYGELDWPIGSYIQNVISDYKAGGCNSEYRKHQYELISNVFVNDLSSVTPGEAIIKPKDKQGKACVTLRKKYDEYSQILQHPPTRGVRDVDYTNIIEEAGQQSEINFTAGDKSVFDKIYSKLRAKKVTPWVQYNMCLALSPFFDRIAK